MLKYPSPSDVLGPKYRLLPRKSQLILATSVLGTSPTWLIHSFILDTFGPSLPNRNLSDQQLANESYDSSLVLVSFLNPFGHFRDGARKWVCRARISFSWAVR